MQTFLIVMLCWMALQVFAGLIGIANRITPKPMTPTEFAVRTFMRLALSGWAIYLLAQGATNV